MLSPAILLAASLGSLSPTVTPGAQDGGQPGLASRIMAVVHAKYGNNERKYETLAKKADKQVREALAKARWSSGAQAGEQRPATAHPFVALVDTLTAAARSQVERKKNSDQVRDLLTRFPWNTQLELPLGLQYGSDRPVPSNTDGFIHLGAPQDELAGFPELLVNHYLYGFDEIVGWRFCIKKGKNLDFTGRTADDLPQLETELPGWEHMRVLLQGSLPEVALFAIPRLTHAIHTRLVELRRGADGSLATQDAVQALLDSRWNGFTFEPPFAKSALAIVVPVHEMITDGRGLLFRFPDSDRLARVGDLPFLSDIAIQLYAEVFRNEKFSVGDFIALRPGAREARQQLIADSAYLSRYRHLIDLIVRAVLSPNLRYPTYLDYTDYLEGMMPVRRETGAAFDMPRKHALLLWAYAGKDPVKVAEFLHEHLLQQEANRFPRDVALPIAFTLLVRSMEKEMLAVVAQRIEDERQGKAATTAEGYAIGDFEREFSPRATFRAAEGDVDSEFLMCSFHAFHEQVTAVIQEAALAAVAKEIGAKDLLKK